MRFAEEQRTRAYVYIGLYTSLVHQRPWLNGLLRPALALRDAPSTLQVAPRQVPPLLRPVGIAPRGLVSKHVNLGHSPRMSRDKAVHHSATQHMYVKKLSPQGPKLTGGGAVTHDSLLVASGALQVGQAP